MSDIKENGIRIDKKPMDEKCGKCGKNLYLCTYKYYKTFKKLAECLECKTYIEIETEKEKKYKQKHH
jgi:hypothetical protein